MIFGAPQTGLRSANTRQFHVSVPSYEMSEKLLPTDPDYLKHFTDQLHLNTDVQITDATATVSTKIVASSRIKQNLDKALSALDEIFSSAMNATVGNLHLDEIEIGLEIGSDGSVGIPGIGIRVTGKSSITVKFKSGNSSA